MYLGDGYVARLRRTWALRIYLDIAYPELIARCRDAMSRVRGAGVIGIYPHGDGCRVVSSYWWAWPQLFPQTGPGRKHTRKIELADWQEKLVERHPVAFFLGLLESDGDSSHRIVNGKDYPFFEFTNQSADIRALFERVCARLGLHFTRPVLNKIAITRRADVEVIRSFYRDSGDPKATDRITTVQ
jgi:hypothetical protein